MAETHAPPDWRAELATWLSPFLERLAHPSQRQWVEVYLWGLLGPGDRKSVAAMASRVAPGAVQQLHHFLSTSPWDPGPLEAVPVERAQRLVGGPDAVLCVDDTALVKKGEMSVGVARQHCGQLGKKASCQALVSLTLARREVPVCIGLRLYLPAAWARDADRRLLARVPHAIAMRPKWRIAPDEIDRVRAAGATFGCVAADAEYGKVPAFRDGLTARGLTYAAGIGPTQKVYPADVAMVDPPVPSPGRGRPPKRPVPAVKSKAVAAFVADLPEGAFRRLSWRRGTKGRLEADFAAVRVRVADGPLMTRAQHRPGTPAWLVCERRLTGRRKYYLTNHPEGASLEGLAAAIKARWVCEQAHQQLKEELGLDHLECRNWHALHHHALLAMMALCFLQHRRLGGEKVRRRPRARPAAPAHPAGGPATDLPRLARESRPMSVLPKPLRLLPTNIGVAEKC